MDVVDLSNITLSLSDTEAGETVGGGVCSSQLNHGDSIIMYSCNENKGVLNKYC